MTEDYNLYPMHVFCLVARMGSVTRAARHLRISQPAVSAHIRTMERRCGEALLERTPRGVALTPAGQVVVEAADKIFSLCRELPQAVEESLGRVRGEVVLAASTTPGAYLASDLLRRFIEQYPEIKPALEIGDSLEILERVQNYTAPIGLIGDIKLPENIEKRVIGSDTVQLMTAPGHPLGRLRRIKANDLRGTTLLLRERGSSTRAAAELLLRDLINSFERVIEIPSTEAIKSSVAAGLGVAFLSSWAVRLEEAANLLEPAADERFRKNRPFYAIKRSDRRLMGPARAFWDFLRVGKVESKK